MCRMKRRPRTERKYNTSLLCLHSAPSWGQCQENKWKTLKQTKRVFTGCLGVIIMIFYNCQLWNPDSYAGNYCLWKCKLCSVEIRFIVNLWTVSNFAKSGFLITYICIFWILPLNQLWHLTSLPVYWWVSNSFHACYFILVWESPRKTCMYLRNICLYLLKLKEKMGEGIRAIVGCE